MKIINELLDLYSNDGPQRLVYKDVALRERLTIRNTMFTEYTLVLDSSNSLLPIVDPMFLQAKQAVDYALMESDT